MAGGTVTALEGTKLENYVDADGNGTIGLGDQLEYIITVYNKGEEQLDAVTLFDVLRDQNNNVLALIAPLLLQVQYLFPQIKIPPMVIYLLVKL